MAIAFVSEFATAADRPFQAFDYDYSTEQALADRMDVDNPDPVILRAVFAKRRERVMQAMPGGAMLIYSVART